MVKFLHGDSARLTLSTTPFSEGSVYFCYDGFIYFDVNIGTTDVPNNQRIQVKADTGGDMSELYMMLGKYNTNLTWNADGTVYTETWTHDGQNYKEVLTEVTADQYTKELFVDEKSVGLWTMTINETDRSANTTYTPR